jgi:hypothetical protein
LSKGLAQALALTFPDTSLFITVVRSSERKIEKAALFDESHSSKSMTLNEMKLGHPSPSVLFPPTIEGFLAVDAGLTISRNSLKTCWPGTESNRRRQPFQGCALPMAIFVERAPMRMAGATGLEPAASCVTGRRLTS